LQNNPDKHPIVFDWDNHQIHLQVHQLRMKEPSWQELPFEIQQAYMQHNMEHEQKVQEQQMMANMQAMAMGQPPGPSPDQQAQQPMKSQPKGKGLSKEVSNALATDVRQAGGVG
jgi:hypothetical protein